MEVIFAAIGWACLALLLAHFLWCGLLWGIRLL